MKNTNAATQFGTSNIEIAFNFATHTHSMTKVGGHWASHSLSKMMSKEELPLVLGIYKNIFGEVSYDKKTDICVCTNTKDSE